MTTEHTIETTEIQEPTIFVQMAAYRDPQLIPTINDMLDKSIAPDLLRIVVCWQHGPEQDIQEFLDAGFDIEDTFNRNGDSVRVLRKKGATIELLDVDFFDTQGACWARNKIQQHYAGEKYTMQLDSHHRFAPHFDKELIEMLEQVRDVSPKPLLTAYVSSFDPENDPSGRILVPWKMDFDRFIPEGAVFFRPSSIDHWKSLTRPMLSRFYSAHFAFADGSFAVEVQHDPEYFFHGEEISIGVRAFTHGYDLYHPHKTVVWHEYTRKNRTKVWDDHTTIQKNRGKVKLDWVERNNICHNRNRILFGMDGQDQKQIDFGKYGFGTERTVKQFEEYAGLSFKYRGCQQKVLDRIEPTLDYKTYDSDEEFKNTISKSNDIRVLLHKDEVMWQNPENNYTEKYKDSDYDFWYLGAHDADGNEVARQDLQSHEIAEYFKNDSVDHRFIFMCDPSIVAKTYTIWPHTKSQGWLNKIIKPVE